MRVYLVRHGETHWNLEGKFQTYLDGPGNQLNEKGKEQARQTGFLLSDEPIDIGYHSALGRSRETAEIILGPRGITLIEDPRLNDGCLGFFDSLTKEEVISQFPDVYSAREKDKFNYRIPDHPLCPPAESYADVFQRVQPFMEELVQTDQNTLLVGHRGVNRVVLGCLLEGTECLAKIRDVIKIKVPNDVCYKITLDPEPKVEHSKGSGWTEGLLIS